MVETCYLQDGKHLVTSSPSSSTDVSTLVVLQLDHWSGSLESCPRRWGGVLAGLCLHGSKSFLCYHLLDHLSNLPFPGSVARGRHFRGPRGGPVLLSGAMVSSVVRKRWASLLSAC